MTTNKFSWSFFEKSPVLLCMMLGKVVEDAKALLSNVKPKAKSKGQKELRRGY
jgi:hypothetical protein